MAVLSDILSRVKFRTGFREGADDHITSNINEATRHTIFRVRPQEMQATTTFATSNATASYAFSTIASDLLAVLFVRDNTDDVPLLRGDIEHFNRLQQDTSDTSNLGDPRRWARQGNNLILYSKIPDSTSRTIKLTYLKDFTDLSAAGDTFPLNDEWLLPVEQYAAGLTFLDLNANDKATAKFTAYEQMISSRESPKGIEDESAWSQMFPISNTGLDSDL